MSQNTHKKNAPSGVPKKEACEGIKDVGQELRQRAEVVLSQSVEMPPLEISKALHELRVHQIELEMQNEELRRTQVEIDEARLKYFDLYDLAPVGYCTISQKGRIVEANLTASKLFGVERGMLIKQLLAHFVFHDDQDVYYLHRKKLFEQGGEQSCELRMVKKNGVVFWAHLQEVISKDSNGERRCRVVISDIDQRRHMEMALRASEEKYRLLTENTSDVIWIYHVRKAKFTYISPAILFLRGYTAEEAMNESLDEMVAQEMTTKVKVSMNANLEDFLQNKDANVSYTSEILQTHKDGRAIWVEVSTKYRYDVRGDVEIVGVSRNIEERKKAEQEIIQLSYHDQLTGLYNRRYYEEQLRHLDVERNLPLTIIMGDVNGLKLINDSFGHVIGDELLRKVAEGIQEGCRAEDVIARLGGDEFVVILPKTDYFEAEQIIKRIRRFLTNEKVNGIDVSVSFGFDTKTHKDEKIQEILKNTEDHMYRHKLYESASIRSKTVDLIINTLYEKNHREMLHSKRVGSICEAIAEKMDFDSDDVNQIRVAGLMHDIGKIGIDENILNNTKKLNHDESVEIKRHSEIGYRILSSVNEFSEIANFVLEHHERWDGKGYPKRLKGHEISLQAGIIAVADTFDAITSERSYGEALSEEAAVTEIRNCSGTQFDEAIARVFIEKVLEKEWV